MRIALAGAGAFGEKHLDGLQKIDGVEIVSIISRRAEQAAEVARKYGAKHSSTELEDALSRDDVDAVILCTPTQMHAAQAIACMNAGKHVQVEIPLADSLADSKAVLDKQQETGLTCMVGHTRRFNPSHQYVHNRIQAGEFNIQQMDVQTYFFRRKNMNAKGEPRSWTDHLLWHHAAHTVDLFAYQAGPVVKANAIEGPRHPELGIAMDMSIQLKSESGAICTLSLSFNNDGPLGTFFRYIGDSGHLYRALRRPREWQGRTDRRIESRRFDERHRIAGPRVHCRYPRRPRAKFIGRTGSGLLPGSARS